MTTTTVSSGQTVSSAFVGSGDTEIVLSGGSSVFPQISGGTLDIQGGFVLAAQISAGHVEVDAGGIFDGDYGTGDLVFPFFRNTSMDVKSGGLADFLNVDAGAGIFVSSGGLLSSGYIFASGS